MKFKNYIIRVLFLLISLNIFSQVNPSQNRLQLPINERWVKQIGSTWDVNCTSIDVDNDGNVYATGYFNYDTNFNLQNNLEIDLQCNEFCVKNEAGNSDIFIAKYDSKGNTLWAKSIGGPYYDNDIKSIKVDNKGFVYLTGSFRGEFDFDPSENKYLVNGLFDGSDVFICKLDPDGNLIWVKNFGGIESNIGYDLAFDSNNDFLITGQFNGSINLGDNESPILLQSKGEMDTFIIKFDENANVIWAKSIGSSKGDSGFKVVLDTNNNIYISGGFVGTADFDPDSQTEFLLTSHFNWNGYFLKLDSNGNFIWANNLECPNTSRVNSITVDANENIYIIGSFESSIDFDPSVNKYILGDYSLYGTDSYIAKYDMNGNLVWVRQIGSEQNSSGISIATDRNENLYINIFFQRKIDLNPDPNEYSNNTLEANVGDFFIGVMDFNGNYKHIEQVGNGQFSFANQMICDKDYNIYTCGYFETEITFFDFNNLKITSLGNEKNAFVYKLGKL